MTFRDKVVWTAGYFDGEGYIGCNGRRSLRLEIRNCDIDNIDKLRTWWGGNLSPLRTTSSNKPIRSWYLYSHTAAGLAMMMYPFLCDRRKRQIKTSFATWTPKYRPSIMGRCVSGKHPWTPQTTRTGKGKQACKLCIRDSQRVRQQRKMTIMPLVEGE